MRCKLELGVIGLLSMSVAHAQWNRLPGDTLIQPSAGTKTSPSICAGNGGYLVVWSDTRNNPFGSSEYETAHDIFGIRLNAQGVPMDPAPFSIASEKGAQTRPKACWNGSSWLVVYETTTIDGNGGYYTQAMASKRVSSAGKLLDAQPINLFGLEPSGYGYAVASDGTNWVIVNQGSPTSADTVAIRISAAGVMLDPPTRVLVPATYYQRSNFRLAYAGGAFLLTFDDAYVNGVNTTGAVRFDSQLNLLTSGIVQLHPTSIQGLTSSGSQFLIAWNHQRPDYYIETRVKRFQPNGTALDPTGIVLSSPAYPGTNVAGAWWDGVNYRIGWIDFTTPKLATVSSTGNVANFNGTAVNGVSFGETAGSGTGQLGFVSTAQSGNDININAQTVTSANAVTTATPVSTGAPRQVRPDIASGANGYMVVFNSQTSGTGRIMIQPFSNKGFPLTSEPIQLAAGTTSWPHVAWNGSNYLVTWYSSTTIFGQRVSETGVKIDANPITIMSATAGEANVAALGGNYLVLGRRFSQAGQIFYAVAARVNGFTGAVMDASPFTIGGTYLRTPPVVVELGGRWLVAYVSNVTHDNSMAGTAGQFINANGTLSGTSFTIEGPFSTAGGNGIFEIGLGSNGTTALLAQPRELTSGVENDLLIHTVSSAGTVGPSANVTPWEGNQYRPKVAWDGNNFVVVYQEQRTRFSIWTMDQIDARSDLFGMRISQSGQVVDPQGFALSTSALAETDPNIASRNSLSVVVASRMAHRGEPAMLIGNPVQAFGRGTPIALEGEPLMNLRVDYNHLGGARQWPVAVAAADMVSGDVPLSTNFVSAGSFDPDGSIVRYHWNFGDGSTAATSNAAHTYTIPGEYTAVLTVTDSHGLSTRQAVKIDATKPNLPPVVNGTQSATTGHAPLDVAFTADGSYDPDGLITNIDWSSNEGTTYYGSPSYYTFYTPGVKTVTLSIRDSRGAIRTKTFTVNVLP